MRRILVSFLLLVFTVAGQPALAAGGLSAEEVGRWAIHPGGKAILDKVQTELELTPEQTQASRNVLYRYGNMSSATSLFVLKELLDTGSVEKSDERVCAIAFGPGLTVESAILSLVKG